MKIRTRITLRTTAIILAVLLVFVALNYFVSTKVRMEEFYTDLKKEGITRAELHFKARAIHDDIEDSDVYIYDRDYDLLYSDGEHSVEPPVLYPLLEEIFRTKEDYKYNKGKYQTIGFIFTYQNADYVVITHGFDEYGYAKMGKLVMYLCILILISLLVACPLGYFLVKSTLRPVAEITQKMKNITVNNLHLRLEGYNRKDEFGELAESFNQSLDIIKSSLESQRMFVFNVSHELRTPLATLIAAIDLSLLKDRTAEEYKATLMNSRQDTDKLISLLNGLLDLARVSYNEIDMNMAPIKIDITLLEAVEAVLKRNPEYDVKLIFDPCIIENPNLTITGNEYLFTTAFANLMENNCKYSENKTSTVRVSCSDTKIMLQFSDTGIGIPKEDIGQLFTPFFRGSNKRYVHGNGIGLALVKKVINLHKGRIDIQSSVGKGTVFTVELNMD